MVYTELQEKVWKFEKAQRLHATTERFARHFASIFVLLGVWLAAFGTIVTQVYTPEKAAKVDMWVLSDIWEKTFVFFQTLALPFWAVLLIIGFGSSAVAALVTVLYYFCAKAICFRKKPQETQETLENTRALRRQFEQVQDAYEKHEVKQAVNFLVCFWASLLLLTIPEEQAGEPDKMFLLGFLYTVLAFLAFIILRATFILLVQALWKENLVLEKEIETALKEKIKRLETRAKEAKEKREKEQREKKAREKKAAFEKEKKENLARADALYKALLENPTDDIERLYEIAILGHHDAALLLAQVCMPQTTSSELTDEEQEVFLKLMYAALGAVGRYDQHCNLTKFFYYTTALRLGEITEIDQAKEVLNELREIKKSGDLPEVYVDVCTVAIEGLVEIINNHREQQKAASWTPSTPVTTTSDYSFSDYSAPISTLEPTIWSDFRTDEPLYRDTATGKIVNAAGEEVSVAWWD